jgi:hypothetical protein
MGIISEFVATIPVYVYVPALLVLLISVALLIRWALQEGREVSFWPPRIGTRPAYPRRADDDFPSERTEKLGSGRIHRIKLPTDQIAYLNLVTGEDAGSAWPIRAGDREIPVGRASTADIVISDPHKTVSQSHFKIYVKPVPGVQNRAYKFFVHDTGSANGTYVNGQAIGYEPFEVTNNDAIEAGSFKFVLHLTFGNPESAEMVGGGGRTVLRRVDQ